MLLLLAGVALLQSAWLLTIPPFRGSDEIDHVYRGLGVAAGQLRAAEPAPEGRGTLVEVPPDVVAAARAQCLDLPYMLPDNCRGVRRLASGDVLVASSAGPYNPAYYVVVGAAGRLVGGAGSDYAMRLASTTWCLLGIGAAALMLSVGGAGAWGRAGLAVGLTPVLVYTTTLPAPNGVEIVAGLVLWTSLLVVLRRRSPRHDRWMLVVGGAAAAVLCCLRLLGPMWAGLIVLACLASVPWRQVLEVLRGHRVVVALCVVAAVVATAANAWWSLGAGLTGTSQDRAELGGDVQLEIGAQPLVWLLQVVAAFPLRADVAPMPVYALVVIVFLALVVTALRLGSTRTRWVLATSLAVVVLLPVALTALTMDTQGVIWQGRYGLPFAVGVPLVAGLALDARSAARREGPRIRALAAAMLALAHAWAIGHVLVNEVREPVALEDPSWFDPPVALVTGLTLAGWWLLATAVEKGTQVSKQQEGVDVRAR